MEDRRYIVGLDFAFSFPLWFCEKLGVKTAFEVWAQAAKEGAGWLHDCSVPFWGRRGTTCPKNGERFRGTERDCASNGSGTRPSLCSRSAELVQSELVRFAGVRSYKLYVKPASPFGRSILRLADSGGDLSACLDRCRE